MIEIFQYQELFINISNIDGIFGQRLFYDNFNIVTR